MKEIMKSTFFKIICLTFLIFNGATEAMDIPQARHSFSDANLEAKWALYNAATEGNNAGVKRLINAGADASSLSYALYATAWRGLASTMQLLIDAKANIEYKDTGSNISSADTPLMVATEKGQEESIRVLIYAGANINQQDKYGNTALMRAVQESYVNCVRLLINSNANLHQENYSTSHNTALTLAAYDNKPLSKERLLIGELLVAKMLSMPKKNIQLLLGIIKKRKYCNQYSFFKNFFKEMLPTLIETNKARVRTEIGKIHELSQGYWPMKRHLRAVFPNLY
jgi:hypothetical protein